jgi:mRNA-degrading endonuclease toxin of MazEF toxin-antitoxin module
MPRACVLNTDHTAPIAKEHLHEPITTLSPERPSEVCRAMTRSTGC